ncbi:ABC transporter substrate-binding protein [Amycolatopsis anabasis]|uniref:ABC transporter substrate-binding protein n=1 Tax=Amycolatopsis anabasis TaxID=1840409 RepID=UPI00131C4FAA|nr:ABC transporter substrate-binding protein [Amycolatopsis anabasis]
MDRPSVLSRRRFLSLAGFGSLTLAACTQAPPDPVNAAGPPRRGGSIVFARIADAVEVKLDPVRMQDNEAIWVASNLFERLYRATPDGGTEPCLATGHILSPDQRTWTFQLRKDVRFSDGSPLTSADVKFSLDRNTSSDGAGANDYVNVSIDRVEAPNPETVVITTKYPTELFGILSHYANGIVPRDFGGRAHDEFFDRPVGTGPFVLERWDVGQQMALVRNPFHWRPGKPYLDRILLTVVHDDNTRMLQLRGRQVDVVEAPPWAQLKDLMRQPGIRIQLSPSTLTDYLALNLRVPPLDHPQARLAISLAIDRAALVQAALFGNGQAAGSLMSPSWPDYDASITPPVRDIGAAKAALANAGRPNGFELTHYVNSGDTVQAAAAQIIQRNLEEIGIRMRIEQYDHNTLEALAGQRQFQMYQTNVSLDIMDPYENIPFLLDPAVGSVAAEMNYHDPEVLEWCRQAEQTTDPAVRTQAYHQIQRRVHRDNPLIPLYYAPFAYATSDRLQGFAVPPTGDYRLEEVWLAS